MSQKEQTCDAARIQNFIPTSPKAITNRTADHVSKGQRAAENQELELERNLARFK